MALLSQDYLAKAIQAGRCVRHDIPLEQGEYLVSRKAASFLYDGSLVVDDRPGVLFCESLFRALPPLAAQVRSSNVRRSILGFCSSLIRQPQLAREEFVHWTLFEFWDEIWRNPNDCIPLVERYYEGTSQVTTTKFGREILPRLRRSDEAYPDIV